MRILGLDLGSRTLGVAMSDSNEKIATMKETFRFEEGDYDAAVDHVLKYVDEYKIQKIVLGLPKHMNGDLGEKAKLSMEFKEVLENEREIEVILIDERLTTVMALNTLKATGANAKKRKSKVDQLAAMNILQTYLDQKR